MSHNGAFHQGLHSLLRQKQSSEKEIQYFLKIISCDPSINIHVMGNSDLNVSNFLENSICIKRVVKVHVTVKKLLIRNSAGFILSEQYQSS